MGFLTNFRADLMARREELRRLGALVDPVRLLDVIIAEFDAVASAQTEPLLNLTQAAGECGYSADSLGRMVRAGRIPNRGRPGAPRVRRSDLPRRAGPAIDSPRQYQASRTQIAQLTLSAHTNGNSPLREA